MLSKKLFCVVLEDDGTLTTDERYGNLKQMNRETFTEISLIQSYEYFDVFIMGDVFRNVFESTNHKLKEALLLAKESFWKTYHFAAPYMRKLNLLEANEDIPECV